MTALLDSARTEPARVLQQRASETDGTFSGRVREARRREDLTLQQAADAVGISRTAFHDAECGARPQQANRALLLQWLERVEDAAAGRPVQPIGSAGEILQAVLARLGMSQAQVAAIIGVTDKHVSRVATGLVRISCEMAIGLERATGVPAAVWNAADSSYRDAKIRRVRAVADV